MSDAPHQSRQQLLRETILMGVQPIAVEGDVAEAAAKSVPLKAVCDPEDVADACMGFIKGSDLATGQVLVVDGGMLIQTPR